MDCEGHPTLSLSHLHCWSSALNGWKIFSSIAALEALWFMYSTQRLWEGMFKAFNHRISSFFLPPSDVICQGLMNCWLCFSGGALLIYYRWTAGPGLLYVDCICGILPQTSLIHTAGGWQASLPFMLKDKAAIHMCSLCSVLLFWSTGPKKRWLMNRSLSTYLGRCCLWWPEPGFHWPSWPQWAASAILNCNSRVQKAVKTLFASSLMRLVFCFSFFF